MLTRSLSTTSTIMTGRCLRIKTRKPPFVRLAVFLCVILSKPMRSEVKGQELFPAVRCNLFIASQIP